MMQALDATLPSKRERDLQLHLGACQSCRKTWNALDETISLLPELERDEKYQMPACDGFWTSIQAQLPVLTTSGNVDKERVRYEQHGWTAISLMGLLLLGISFAGLSEVGDSGPLALIGGVAGWVYAWLKSLGTLMSRLLGPDWIVVAEWVLPMLAGGLLYLVGRRFMSRMPDAAYGNAYKADDPVLREGRMVG